MSAAAISPARCRHGLWAAWCATCAPATGSAFVAGTVAAVPTPRPAPRRRCRAQAAQPTSPVQAPSVSEAPSAAPPSIAEAAAELAQATRRAAAAQLALECRAFWSRPGAADAARERTREALERLDATDRRAAEERRDALDSEAYHLAFEALGPAGRRRGQTPAAIARLESLAGEMARDEAFDMGPGASTVLDEDLVELLARAAAWVVAIEPPPKVAAAAAKPRRTPTSDKGAAWRPGWLEEACALLGVSIPESRPRRVRIRLRRRLEAEAASSAIAAGDPAGELTPAAAADAASSPATHQRAIPPAPTGCASAPAGIDSAVGSCPAPSPTRGPAADPVSAAASDPASNRQAGPSGHLPATGSGAAVVLEPPGDALPGAPAGNGGLAPAGPISRGAAVAHRPGRTDARHVRPGTPLRRRAPPLPSLTRSPARLSAPRTGGRARGPPAGARVTKPP